jgi:hypothetical protein
VQGPFGDCEVDLSGVSAKYRGPLFILYLYMTKISQLDISTATIYMCPRTTARTCVDLSGVSAKYY